MSKKWAEEVCCCGCQRVVHREAGTGSCMTCGGLGCAKFHRVGEGHNFAFEIVVAIAVVAGAVAFWFLVGRFLVP